MSLLKNKETMLSIGMISLALSIVLRRYGGESTILNFLEGVLIGLSLVLNLVFLILYRKEKDQ
ncbi:MAG: hypothetical protein V1769_06005 [Thermoplasmatota archaeon]